MDAEFKKLLAGPAWAQDGDRIDPDSASVTPVLSRATGWPSSYSQVDGNVPDRRRFNQILRELAGGAKEVAMGVSLYDSQVNYPIHAITNHEGLLYRAIKANGPISNNVQSPVAAGQTSWARVSGSTNAPDAPQDFVFDNDVAGQVTVRWEPGRDNGARIEGYYFQFRTASDSPWAPASPGEQLTYAEKVVQNLPTDTILFVRAAAFNAQGTGPYAEDRNGEVVTGTVPGGGNLLGLLATPGDMKVTTSWSAPPTGGHPITLYSVQWRDATEAFSGSQQSTIADATTLDITGLDNGTEYFFRVAATNRIGQGAWSNIAKATPLAPAVAYYPPGVAAPTLTTNGSTGFTASTNIINSTLGATAPVDSTEWEYRQDPGTTWTTISGGKTTATVTGLGNGTYLVRYRVTYTINSVVRTTDWSAGASLTIQGPVPDAPISVYGSAVWISVANGLNQPGYLQYSITPGRDNGFPITQYAVRCTLPSRAGGSDPNNQGSTPVRISFQTSTNSGRAQQTSLARGGTGRIYARCRNVNGWGPWKEGNIVTVGGPNYTP